MKNSKYTAVKIHALAFLAALTCAGAVSGQATDPSFEKQIDALFASYNASTAGVAVAVVKDGKVVFKRGYGAANLEYGLPITTKTVFQIASTSKQFTAFAIYLLEKQGKVSFEDDVRKYIPELPDYGKTVRIRHLLAHTSGVKDQFALLTLAGLRPEDVMTTGQVLRMISRQKELNSEPGARFIYGNSGYTLLAEIVKRVSGQSFAEFAKKYIFLPLGMNDTQINDDYERIIRNRAESYEVQEGVLKKMALNDAVGGPSNLYTTVEDLAKWAMNFEKPIVGDRELIERFNAPSLLDNGERVVGGMSDGEPIYHAKGQNNWNYRGLRLLSFGGHSAAFRSFLGRFPEQRLAVIALSNDEHYQNFDTSIKIAELYLGDKLKPKPTSTNAPAVPTRTFEKPYIDSKGFEGRFFSEELEAFYSVRAAGEKVILSHLRRGDIELTATGKDKFSGRIAFPVEIEFTRDGNGAVAGFQISNFGAKNVKFIKIR